MGDIQSLIGELIGIILDFSIKISHPAHHKLEMTSDDQFFLDFVSA